MATTITERQSWISRLGGSFKNILFGLVLFVIAFPVLFKNEGRAVNTAKRLEEGRGAVVSLASADVVDPANEGKLVHVTGRAATPDVLTDTKFGVSVRNKLRLTRKVNMLQWVENVTKETKDNLGGSQTTKTTYTYAKEWAGRYIDSQNFKEQGHDNPPFPDVSDSDFQAANVSFGAFALPQDIVSSIRTDGKLAVGAADVDESYARFAEGGILYIPSKPEAEVSQPPVSAAATNAVGVSAAETNAAPVAANAPAQTVSGNPFSVRDSDIGDVKVEFFAVDEMDVSIISMQSGKSFAPYSTSKGQLQLVSEGMRTADEMFTSAEKANAMFTWIIRGVGLLLMFMGIKTILGPIVILGAVVPFVAKILDFGVGAIAIAVSLICTLAVVALAWLFYRPIYSAVIAVAIVAVVVWLMRRKRAKAGAAGSSAPAA